MKNLKKRLRMGAGLVSFLIAGVASAGAVDERSPSQGGLMSLSVGASFAKLSGNAQVSSPFGSGSRDIDKDGTGLALEFRYRLLRQQLAGLYLFAGYDYYDSLERADLFLDQHPGAALDTGIGVRLRDVWRFGLGYSIMFNRSWGFGLLAGAHYSRVRAQVISDEGGGGGPRNVFERSETMFNPLLGAEVFYALALGNMRRAELFLRAERRWLDDVTAQGTSPFTGATYTGRAGLDHMDSATIGVRIPF